MSKKPPAAYEPGQLDKTRKNLGSLGQEEAERMTKILGGEIGVEKMAPMDEKVLKKISKKYSGRPATSPRRSGFEKPEATQDIKETQTTEKAGFEKKQRIPVLNSRERLLFDRLMSSPMHRIRPAPGLFSILFPFARGGPERILEGFIQESLTMHISHIDSFIEAMQHLIIASPADYKRKIKEDDAPHFRALKLIYSLDTLPLKTQLARLKQKKSWIVIEDLIPFTQEFYRSFMPLYFLGESQMTLIIKQLYAMIAAKRPASNGSEQNLNYAKQAGAEWLYIFGQVIKGLYPLLMRMTGYQCELYHDFFSKNISKILQFLDITKYDLILPQKKLKNAASAGQEEAADDGAADEEAGEDNEIKEDQTVSEAASSLVSKDSLGQSLAVMERLFPLAGWSNLNLAPDMYPYFQNLYQFNEGFNLVSPANPLHITIVLLRIIEDFFQGCRNISFNAEQDSDLALKKEILQKMFTEWSQYREVVFDRILSPDLKEYVNHMFLQTDLKKTKYGKRQLSNWLWQVKYYFHPHLDFEITFIEAPKHTEVYAPLAQQVEFLVQFFAAAIQDAGIPEKAGRVNFNEPYRFDVENQVSYRLDILLGGKTSANRTNINLMKYTLCALRVLYWWINDQNSFAYRERITVPYRSESDTGEPIFSVPLRTDQRELFIQQVKLAVSNAKTVGDAGAGTS